ncbi:GTPase required for pre-60S ribosomal subunit nuclear export and maturation [Recurvomyces mirabilis]|nr:GTPase required for pre-60S ribosomal subunit nuclear export and maturation [Recurvomyces mirabilis]
MGTGKKEASRRTRQGVDSKSDGMGNVHTKGENFYRSAKRVKSLNTFKEGRAERNASGKITKAASFQSRDKPQARIEPHRKWFTNTRVISQEALGSFRDAVEAQQKDPYSYLLKRNKLPMSLIDDGKAKERKDGVVQHRAKMRLETEGFGEVFGPKAQRKRPRLAVSSLGDFAAATSQEQESYSEKLAEAAALSQGTTDEVPVGEVADLVSGELTTAKEAIFSKGQSKRIWNELYKVIDSSDVVIHVLDARDPLGTRCKSVEKYIREEAPHKHLLFLLNKCDLVPTSVASKWVHHLSLSHPTLAFHASLTNSFGKGTLITLLRQFSTLHSARKQISVGFIGYPNTGKSSIINTLRAKKVCKTAPIPGETKVWQYITLMKRIYLIDCPGIVPPEMGLDDTEVLLRGVVRVENVSNPAQYVPAVLAVCRRKYLERTYGITGWWKDAEGVEVDEVEQMVGTAGSDEVKVKEAVRFLELLARKGGRLLKGGEADMDGVAKMVLNDFLRGKIPWFIPPPAGLAMGDGGAAVGSTAVEGAEATAKDGGSEAVGRDEMLGITHGKRKRDVLELVGQGARGLGRVNEVVNGLAEGQDEEDEDDDEVEEGDDDFAGFDEEDVESGEEEGEDLDVDLDGGVEGGVAIEVVSSGGESDEEDE